MPHQFQCFQRGCEFMIRADSTDEVVRHVQLHAEETHGLTLEAADIETEIEAA